MRTRRDELLALIETLTRYYYLVQALNEEGHAHINLLRGLVTRLPKAQFPRLCTEVRRDIGRIRRETKCLLSDEQVTDLVKQMTTGAMGFVNLPKWYIDKYWFANYVCVFPRWPHVPFHALVQFDTRPEGISPYSILATEGMLFEDAEVMWRNVLRILSDGKDFRTRSKTEQRELQSFERATVTAVYRFVEAYLNGIAYDCFQAFHDTMELTDHDLLAEWDSKGKRTRYVSFERKLKEYPEICGKYIGRKVDLRGDEDVECLLSDGKVLRDGLTHPSPFIYPKKLTLEKIRANIAIYPEQVKGVFRGGARYIWKVENALGRDPKKSAPWLQVEFLES